MRNEKERKEKKRSGGKNGGKGKRRRKKRKGRHPWLSPLAPAGLGTGSGDAVCLKLSVPMSASLFSVDDLTLYFKNGSRKAQTPQLVASTFKTYPQHPYFLLSFLF